MTNTNFARRLERLESVGDGSGSVVVMSGGDGEPVEAVEARWRAEHPGQVIGPGALCVIIRTFADEDPPLEATA